MICAPTGAPRKPAGPLEMDEDLMLIEIGPKVEIHALSGECYSVTFLVKRFVLNEVKHKFPDQLHL